MKKVLLFGGTFDPIHNAHINLCEIAFKTINADFCYFILAKNPRWKTPCSRPEDRLNMLKLALKDKPNFKISLIEYNSKEDITYTYNTIVEFKKTVKDDLYYLIGADQLNKLHEWYKIDELSKLVKFICISRPDYEVSSENEVKYNVYVINENVSSMSSTKLRELIDASL